MSDLPITEPTLPAPARKTWQVSVRTLALLVAVVAVGMVVFVNVREIARLRQRIDHLKPMARELEIDEPARVAVIKLEEMWYDENRWDLWLPSGSYRVCLATREVVTRGFPPTFQTAPLAPGRQRLALEQQRTSDGGTRLAVTRNGTEVLAVEEPRGWDPGTGSEGGGLFGQSTQLAREKPVELFRRRFMQPTGKGMSTTPQGPTNGMVLWIERTGAARP